MFVNKIMLYIFIEIIVLKNNISVLRQPAKLEVPVARKV